MNLKKKNRKGFTIVELVIVIAVIAILATVLVPTFGNVIEKANKSKLVQGLRNEYTTYTATVEATAWSDDIVIKMTDDKYYQITNGNPGETPTEVTNYTGSYWDAANDKWVTGTATITCTCTAGTAGAGVDSNSDGKCDVCNPITP